MGWKSRAFRSAFLLVLVIRAAVSEAGVVQTLDGKRTEGEVKLDGKGNLTVTAAGGTPAVVALEDVLHAEFGGEKRGTKETPARAPAPPGRWIGRDIGNVGKPGASLLAGGNLIVQAAGTDIGGGSDSFHFAYKPLTGDGELVARVLRLEPGERPVKIGLMMRAGVDPAATHASIIYVPRSGVSLQVRNRPGAPLATKEPGMGAGALPAFLKLKRQGRKFTATYSDDGNNWQRVGEEEFDLPATVLAGVAVASRSGVAPVTATLEKVTLEGPGVEQEKDRGPSSFRKSPGVLFRNGSFLAGHNPRVTEDGSIRLVREREYSFTPNQVSAVFLGERTPDAAERVAKAQHPGVLMQSGDYVEGSVREADRGRVRVSSVLFGLKQFEFPRVRAVVFGNSSPSAARYELRLNDGSVLFTDSLTPEKDTFKVELQPAGVLSVKGWDVVELKAGPGRFEMLSKLKPAAVEAPGDLLGEAYSVSERSADASEARGVTLGGNVSVSYSLGGGYRSLTARLVVPAELLPTTPVDFVVLGDGKELHRTPGRTSLDEAAQVTVQVKGVEKLTLRVEAKGSILGVAGNFADASLVK